MVLIDINQRWYFDNCYWIINILQIHVLNKLWPTIAFIFYNIKNVIFCVQRRYLKTIMWRSLAWCLFCTVCLQITWGRGYGRSSGSSPACDPADPVPLKRIDLNMVYFLCLCGSCNFLIARFNSFDNTFNLTVDHVCEIC